MDPHPNWARVGYQGEPGAYSEEAAIAVLPQATTIGFPTFTRAFDALASREVDAAVLPVENSLGGIVQEVNDLLWERSGVRVSGEVIHPVRHCLLGRGEPVVRALSHPQALLQCRKFLEARGIQPVSFHDTAGAARAVAEGMVMGNGAIASAAAAKRYGLKLIAEGIQDDDTNQTRFAIVDRGIDLTRLDSRPVPNQPWQYRFYVDFEISDPQAASEALKALEEEATEVKLFGSYPAAE